MGDEKIHDLTHAYDNSGAFQPERRWMLATLLWFGAKLYIKV